jgi:hypothetical protein
MSRIGYSMTRTLSVGMKLGKMLALQGVEFAEKRDKDCGRTTEFQT